MNELRKRAVNQYRCLFEHYPFLRRSNHTHPMEVKAMSSEAPHPSSHVTLEEVLRARYKELGRNIHYDKLRTEEYAARTGLRDADHKRTHQAMKDRIQVEYYKLDEDGLLAHRAGIEL
jgi:hypothetical protein